MSWLLITLVAPALWGATNFIDKYLLNRFFKTGGEGALFIFSAIIGAFVTPLVAVVYPESLSYPLIPATLIALNGALYIVGLIPYVYALQRGDASVVIPLFQLIPVFSFVFAWLLLGETLSVVQVVGGTLIIGGSIVLSFEMSNARKLVFNVEIFLLMVLSSLLLSLTFLFFKIFALESTFLTTVFWENVGFVVFAVLLLLVPVYRQQFSFVLKENSASVLSLNALNELLNLVAKFAFNYASLLVPITLVWFINGFQTVFVFVYGIFLTVFLPSIIREKISVGHLTHRLLTICVMLVGTLFLYL